MKDKKGMEHVEVVISFLIFVTFVTFLFVFLNPFKQRGVSDSVSEAIQEKIQDYGKIDFLYTSVNVNLTRVTGSCFNIENLSNSKVIVKNASGIRVNAAQSANRINIQKSEEFYFIFYSSMFTEQGTFSSCTSLNAAEYKIGSVQSIDVYSLNKFITLNASYHSDYESLKGSLGIENDFGFVIKDVQGNEIVRALKKATMVNIKAVELPVPFIDENANIEVKILSIYLW